MVNRVLRTSLLAGAVAAPVMLQAQPAAAHDLEIHSITLRPAEAVVRPESSVRVVIEVVARGVAGKDGMTIKVEPGAPPERDTPDTGRDDEADPEPTAGPRGAPRPGGTPGPTPPVAGPLPAPAPDMPPAIVPLPAPRLTAGGTPAPTGSASPAVRTPVPVRPGFPPVATAARTSLDAGAVEKVAATPVLPGTGWRTWRFLPEKGLTRWYPMGRWTVAVTARGADGSTATEYATFLLRRDTRFAGIEAERVPARRPTEKKGHEVLRVRGVLNRIDPKGFVDYAPFAGQRVEIQHRPAGGKWTRVATAGTDADGRFSRRVGGVEDGEWRVGYAGNNHHAPGYGPARPVRG